MISLTPIQASFILQNGTATSIYRYSQRRILRKKSSISASSNPDNSDEQTPKPEGDSRRQELLAEIAMLQTQKLRLTDYLDERSAYLTQFAEEANSEIDRIGENAFRELDEAGARIMGNIENRMQAFEESMELNKSEIEENEKKVSEFEVRIEKDRNEGLFFKGLKDGSSSIPIDNYKAKAKEEQERIQKLTEKNAAASSVTRRNIYLALIGLVAIGIIDAAFAATFDWKKLAVLGLVLVGLISQLIYEQSLFSETGTTEENEEE
ncbi:hypothetical protein M569_14657, partial [Genlisea aurea]